MKKEYNLKTRFLEDELPFAQIGKGPNVLISLEGLSFKNETPSGFESKEFIKSVNTFTEDYTIYLVGRKPNLPSYYSFERMIDDYAAAIRREFKEPVDVMGGLYRRSFGSIFSSRPSRDR